MTGAHFGIVVVDNGSTDDSVSALTREFPEITVLAQGQNRGFVGGCNIGIRHALADGADFVLLLNNDTTVAPDFLAEMLAAIDSDARVAAVCPKIYFADAPGAIWYAGADFSLWTGTPRHRGWRQVDRGQFDDRHSITQATGCAMLIRKSAICDAGLLDEQFWAYVEDLEWSVRVRKAGYRLAFAPRAHVWHQCGATAVASMGNGSHAIPQLLSARNMIFLARKHARWWQVPSFTVGFLINHVARHTILRVWHCDFRAVFAIYRGLARGLFTEVVPASGRVTDRQVGYAIGGTLAKEKRLSNADRN